MRVILSVFSSSLSAYLTMRFLTLPGMGKGLLSRCSIASVALETSSKRTSAYATK